MSGVRWDRRSSLFLRLRFKRVLCCYYPYVRFCDHPYSDYVQLGAGQIFRFVGLSTCVQAHWFRLRRIWIKLYRVFPVTNIFRHVRVKFLVRYRPQFLVRLP